MAWKGLIKEQALQHGGGGGGITKESQRMESNNYLTSTNSFDLSFFRE